MPGRTNKSSRSIAQQILSQPSKTQRHLRSLRRGTFSGPITLQQLQLSTAKVATAQVNFDGRAIVKRQPMSMMIE